ncbi:putative membrane protein [Anaplasma phagocytophilum str. ApMUC09]|uniref:Putative membrane protein n=1 Tax=Anaplasma phagocytophilum str. ApMUC09 TaxID=1359152 RepID=A0A0F3NCN7_ANAPH|nr:putative membrane protein [Anaplasma phagocytophilum str. ApMUC09]
MCLQSWHQNLSTAVIIGSKLFLGSVMMSMAIVMAGNDVGAHDDVSALDTGMGMPSRTLTLPLSGLHILLLLICFFILISITLWC